jgi:hypothetical protein
MIKQKELSKAAINYSRKFKDSKLLKENVAIIAFADGAEWADKKANTSTIKRRHIGVNLEERYTLFINGEFVATSNSLPKVQEIYDTMMLEINEDDKLTIIRRRNYKPF